MLRTVGTRLKRTAARFRPRSDRQQQRKALRETWAPYPLKLSPNARPRPAHRTAVSPPELQIWADPHRLAVRAQEYQQVHAAGLCRRQTPNLRTPNILNQGPLLKSERRRRPHQHGQEVPTRIRRKTLIQAELGQEHQVATQYHAQGFDGAVLPYVLSVIGLPAPRLTPTKMAPCR